MISGNYSRYELQIHFNTLPDSDASGEVTLIAQHFCSKGQIKSKFPFASLHFLQLISLP